MKPEIKLKCMHRPAGRCCVLKLLSSYASACAYTATNAPYFCHHHFDSSSFLYRFISGIRPYFTHFRLILQQLLLEPDALFSRMSQPFSRNAAIIV